MESTALVSQSRVSWSWGPPKARLTVPTPGISVTAWEASGQFTDVTAEMGARRNQVVVKARVLRPAPKSKR